MSDRRPRDAGDPLASPPPDDWPAQAADTIVRVVGQVRDKTTRPAETVVRGVVYGLLGGLLGLVCLVLVAIALVRILVNYVVGDDNVWLAHFIVGMVFTLAGSVLLFVKAREPREER
jgi:hypothetical protein